MSTSTSLGAVPRQPIGTLKRFASTSSMPMVFGIVPTWLIHRRATWAYLAYVVLDNAYYVYEFRIDHEWNLARWDWMFHLGSTVFITTGVIALLADRRFDTMIDRLWFRGSLNCSREDIQQLKRECEKASQRYSVIVGAAFVLVAALAVLGVLLWAMERLGGYGAVTFDLVDHPVKGWSLKILSIENPKFFGGYPIYREIVVYLIYGLLGGFRLGRHAAYGRFARIITGRGIAWRMQPGHPDKAAGMAPVGVFFSFQALVAAVPVFWMSLWISLQVSASSLDPIVRKSALLKDPQLKAVIRKVLWGYESWFYPCVGIWVVALAIAMLTFILPLRDLRAEMKSNKRRILEENRDRISTLTDRINGKLLQSDSMETFIKRRTQLAGMREYSAELEGMPTWPVDFAVWRTVLVSNGLLAVLPAVSKIVLGALK